MAETFNRLSGIRGHHLLQPRIHADDLARLDFDIRRGALETGRRLVDQNARIGQRRSFALGTACEQYGAHAGRHADARRRYPRLDEVHGVVDRKAGIDLSAGAIDVHLDLAVRIILGQVQQLCHDQVRDHVVDRRAQEYDPILQEQREDVVAALTRAGLLDHHRYRVCGGCVHHGGPPRSIVPLGHSASP